MSASRFSSSPEIPDPLSTGSTPATLPHRSVALSLDKAKLVAAMIVLYHEELIAGLSHACFFASEDPHWMTLQDSVRLELEELHQIVCQEVLALEKLIPKASEALTHPDPRSLIPLIEHQFIPHYRTLAGAFAGAHLFNCELLKQLPDYTDSEEEFEENDELITVERTSSLREELASKVAHAYEEFVPALDAIAYCTAAAEPRAHNLGKLLEYNFPSFEEDANSAHDVEITTDRYQISFLLQAATSLVKIAAARAVRRASDEVLNSEEVWREELRGSLVSGKAKLINAVDDVGVFPQFGMTAKGLSFSALVPAVFEEALRSELSTLTDLFQSAKNLAAQNTLQFTYRTFTSDDGEWCGIASAIEFSAQAPTEVTEQLLSAHVFPEGLLISPELYAEDYRVFNRVAPCGISFRVLLPLATMLTRESRYAFHEILSLVDTFSKVFPIAYLQVSPNDSIEPQDVAENRFSMLLQSSWQATRENPHPSAYSTLWKRIAPLAQEQYEDRHFPNARIALAEKPLTIQISADLFNEFSVREALKKILVVGRPLEVELDSVSLQEGGDPLTIESAEAILISLEHELTKAATLYGKAKPIAFTLNPIGRRPVPLLHYSHWCGGYTYKGMRAFSGVFDARSKTWDLAPYHLSESVDIMTSVVQSLRALSPHARISMLAVRDTLLQNGINASELLVRRLSMDDDVAAMEEKEYLRKASLITAHFLDQPFTRATLAPGNSAEIEIKHLIGF